MRYEAEDEAGRLDKQTASPSKCPTRKDRDHLLFKIWASCFPWLVLLILKDRILPMSLSMVAGAQDYHLSGLFTQYRTGRTSDQRVSDPTTFENIPG